MDDVGHSVNAHGSQVAMGEKQCYVKGQDCTHTYTHAHAHAHEHTYTHTHCQSKGTEIADGNRIPVLIKVTEIGNFFYLPHEA